MHIIEWVTKSNSTTSSSSFNRHPPFVSVPHQCEVISQRRRPTHGRIRTQMKLKTLFHENRIEIAKNVEQRIFIAFLSQLQSHRSRQHICDFPFQLVAVQMAMPDGNAWCSFKNVILSTSSHHLMFSLHSPHESEMQTEKYTHLGTMHKRTNTQHSHRNVLCQHHWAGNKCLHFNFNFSAIALRSHPFLLRQTRISIFCDSVRVQCLLVSCVCFVWLYFNLWPRYPSAFQCFLWPLLYVLLLQTSTGYGHIWHVCLVLRDSFTCTAGTQGNSFSWKWILLRPNEVRLVCLFMLHS